MLNPLLPFPLLFIFFFLTIFLVKWIYSTSRKTTHKNPPPSPPKLPILGNLHYLGTHPHRSLQQLAHRYGELMLLHLGIKPVLVVSSSDAAREIMKTNDTIFANRPKLAFAERLLYEGKDVSAAPYGEYWRRMRSICVLQLLSHKRVESFRAVREEELGLLVQHVKQSSLLSLPMNLSEMFASLTSDVVCRVAFGRKYSSGGEGGRRFKELLGEFTELLGGFNVGDFIPWLGWINQINGLDAKVERVAKQFDEFLDVVVEEHVGISNTKEKNSACVDEGEDRKDIVDVLLEVQEHSNIAGFSIDRDNIKGTILDMFAGGTDTTYTVLEWAMTRLLRHPRVLKNLQNEIAGISNGKQDIAESELEKMHYLKAVIKETLRLHPPIPLLAPRESMEDVKVKGYDIAARTMVFVNAWTIGRDPALWDDPEEFKPERFVNSAVDFKGHDFQLLPFGAGRRGCPGILFAMATIELVLANLVHKFDWELPCGARIEDLDMRECSGIVIHREVALLVVPKLRSF